MAYYGLSYSIVIIVYLLKLDMSWKPLHYTDQREETAVNSINQLLNNQRLFNLSQ